mgnify:CR=1 FL=1
MTAFFAERTPQQLFVLVVLTSSFGILLWASLAKVDVIVRTEGRIIPAGKSQIVQHLEGGIVRKILVQEGQVVTSDQPLMELSDIQARSSLGQGQSKRAALRGREARLVAEVHGHAGIKFPDDLHDQEVIKVETSAWQARRAQLSEEIRVLRAQSSQKQGELNETASKRSNLQGELEVLTKQLKVIEGLRRNNAASEMEVLEIQARIKRLNSQIAEATTAHPRLKAAQTEAESRVSEAIARFRAEASAALTQVREELERAHYEIGSTADRVDRGIVRAPVSGFINKLNVSTVGGVVRPSEVLLEITPSDQRIVIETRAKPNDRANLQRGLPVRVRIGAYDYATFGTLDGQVTDVSADTITDERGARFYRVNIEVTMHTPASHQTTRLVPGMAATADVVVGKRSIISYLLSPLLKFRDGTFRAETTIPLRLPSAAHDINPARV